MGELQRELSMQVPIGRIEWIVRSNVWLKKRLEEVVKENHKLTDEELDRYDHSVDRPYDYVPPVVMIVQVTRLLGIGAYDVV